MDFVQALRNLGYEVDDLGNNRVAFKYLIPVGKFLGQEINLGFEVPGDFSLSPPGGPHMSPHLLPINAVAGTHPNCGVHQSPFGQSWQYWSRPFPEWPKTDRTVRTYMAHIKHLFDTQ